MEMKKTIHIIHGYGIVDFEVESHVDSGFYTYSKGIKLSDGNMYDVSYLTNEDTPEERGNFIEVARNAFKRAQDRIDGTPN